MRTNEAPTRALEADTGVSGNICYRPQEMGQIGALAAVASVAVGLTEAELRVLLGLAALAVSDPDCCCVISLRKLAKSTGLAVSSVQLAVDGLSQRRYIAVRRGTASKSTAFLVSALQTRVFASSSPVPMVGTPPSPPVPTIGTVPVPMVGTPTPSLERGSVPMVGTPSEAESSANSGFRGLAQNVLFDRTKSVVSVLEEIDRGREGVENPIDAIAKAHPRQFGRERVELARRWMYGLTLKLAREKDRHPPDDKIVAQFLSIAPWPRLLGLLVDIQSERLEVGYSYGWFLTVALQRIHGVEWSPARQRAAKREAAQLRVVPPGGAEPPPVAPPAPAVQGGLDFPAPGEDAGDGREFAAELLGQLRAKVGKL